MEKPAITTYTIHPVVEKRWSPRAFSNKTIEDEKILSILEAARWAPSSFNEQPWRFVIGKKGSKTFEKIYDTLIEFNQKWAKNAGVLVQVIGKTKLTSNNKPNGTYHYDVGQSVAHMTFQATHEGLYMHQMGGFSKEQAIDSFKIPEGYEPLTVFALGYAGDINVLEESFQKMELSERVRMPLNDIAFEENFGNTLSYL